MSASPPISLPGGFNVSRRELIAAIGGFVVGGVSGLNFSARPLTHSLELNSTEPEIEIDPFWTERIYEESGTALRPSERPQGQGQAILPDLIESARAQDSGLSRLSLYYFDGESNKFIAETSVTPAFEEGSVSMITHLLAAHVSTQQQQNREDHATFKLDLGDAVDEDSKFGTLLTGMNIFKDPALGAQINQPVLGIRPPIIVKEGQAQLTFNFWRHKPTSWCSRILGFIKSGVDVWTKATNALVPLIVIPQVGKPVLEVINRAIGLVEGVDKNGQDEHKWIWQAGRHSFAVTKQAQKENGWPYSIRAGDWILTDPIGAERLDLDSDLILHRSRDFFLAHRQEPNKPVLSDVNYMVLRFVLNQAQAATG